MKELLMKKWKNIIFVIVGIAIAINLFFVITTPATIVEDYAKYGPSYTRDYLSITDNVDEDAEGIIDSAAEDMSAETGIETDSTRVIIIFALLIVGCLILQNIMDSPAPAKKK